MEVQEQASALRAGTGARLLLAVAMGWGVGAIVRAYDAVPERLTLADALGLAESRNPVLRAQAQAIESVSAGEVTAGLRPNPTFQNDTTSATLGVYQEIEIGGKRRARLESARLATAISGTDFADARRSLFLAVRQAFTNALLARANVALANENVASFQKVIDLNRIRFDNGALSGADFLRIELQMLQFQTDLSDAKLALATARTALRAQIGRPDLPQDFEVEGTLDPVPVTKTVEELRDLALASRPDLHSAETGRRKAAADVQLAKANRIPDPTIGASLLHTGREIGGPSWFQPFYPKADTTNSMGLGISIPIPLFNRNQGEIARTLSEERRAGYVAEAVRNQVLQDVEAAWATLEATRDRLRLYDQTYLARARESRDIAEFAFQKGATSILDLLDAERTYRATLLAYQRDLAAYQTAVAQLEAAVAARVAP